MEISSAATNLLGDLLPEWHLLLQGWSADGRLTAAAKEALLLNGEPQALTDLTTQWSAGEFGGLPPIVLLSAADINGAMGAYAISTGTIYLNADWLAGATKEQVLAVLTEELGHHLDGVLNSVDTAGDEGEYFARLLSGETLSSDASSGLRQQGEGGSITVDGNLISAEFATTTAIRGNSLYTIVSGPSWTQAEANSIALGGHLVSVQDAEENLFIGSIILATGTESVTYWIGLTDSAIEGEWKWSSGESLTYTNWSPGEPNANDVEAGPEDYAALYATSTPAWLDISNGNEYFRERGFQSIGIAEIPLSLSITRTGEVKEGSGLFTTSINLSAGTQASGNLAEGSQVWWKVTGVTADDLLTGALTGTGVITGGKLDIQHSLVQDADIGEKFEVSVFSDAERTQQILYGPTRGGYISAVEEAGGYTGPAGIRGNSVYLTVAGPTWSEAETQSNLLGGHLTAITSESENSWITSKFGRGGDLNIQNWYKGWIGLKNFDGGTRHEWTTGESYSFSSWQPGNPTQGPFTFINVTLTEVNFSPTFNSGVWVDFNDRHPSQSDTELFGIAEIPLTSSITFSTTPKEGAGVFTTSINLSSGTEASGNLAEGAQIWWNITGITADDLASGALSGSGVISGGKIDISHSLRNDGIAETENFVVTVYSDPTLKTSEYQIGSASSVLIENTGAFATQTAIRSNSLYTIVQGPSWAEAELNAQAIGGTLAEISDQSENIFLQSSQLVSGVGASLGVWIGLTRKDGYFADGKTYGDWLWTSGNLYGSGNEVVGWNQDFFASGDGMGNEAVHMYTNQTLVGSWNDVPLGSYSQGELDSGIAEILLTSSITFSATPKEGSGVFTTSINLSAGTPTSGNLANGTTAYWKVTGITADDLAAGALTGSGVISGGKLDLQHSLTVDADNGEMFEVSVFSDASMTSEYQIGTKSSVLIVDGNNSPTDLILNSSGIQENSAAGTLIGTLSPTDPDVGSSFTYALVAGNGTNDADNALVEIIGNEVKVKSGAAIDFETNPVLNLNIQVTDNGTPGLTYTKAVTAAVLNVNEVPTDLVFTSGGIKENSTAGTLIGTLGATDPDAGSTFTYALVAGNGTNDADNALVEIIGNEVKVKSGATIDFETNPVLNLNIKVTDNGTPGLTYTKAVTAAVLDVVETPADTTPPTISSISTQGTTVLLKFSETVSASNVLPSAFAVATIDSRNRATNRTISTIALDQNDPTRVILTLTRTAPASTVNLRVSYTDPANNQTTAVIQDTSGNDLASFSNRFADTFITAATTTLASQYQNLTLTGNRAVSGTGNSLANTITGNSANNTIRGLGGADKLTGLGGVDTFTYALADSRLAAFDHITDFAIGTDRIDGPSAISAANLRELGSVSALTQAGISALLTSSTFVRNGAATFSFGTGPSARTFLALNDRTAGYSSTSDGLIEITGFTGSLTNLAVI